MQVTKAVPSFDILNECLSIISVATQACPISLINPTNFEIQIYNKLKFKAQQKKAIGLVDDFPLEFAAKKNQD